MKAPLFAIFKREYLFNTLTACAWMAAAFCVYYSIWALFSTYLQKELHWTPAMVATPLFWANIVVFAGSAMWGGVADKWGRRPAIIVPGILAIFVTPLYLWTHDPTMIIVRLHPAGRVRRLDLRPEPELPVRALPDRGAGHGRRASSTIRARSGAA